MEDPRIISALFIFLKMAYYNVLINIRGTPLRPLDTIKYSICNLSLFALQFGFLSWMNLQQLFLFEIIHRQLGLYILRLDSIASICKKKLAIHAVFFF